MPIRRFTKADAPVFVTQATWHRDPFLRIPGNASLLLERLRACKERHPFRMIAYAIMPDHFHLLLVPQGTATISTLMGWTKATFTLAFRERHNLPTGLMVWQKGFWDHIIRDDEDLNRHIDYIHYNPVHHGLTDRPEDWPRSSFSWWKDAGHYEDGWGWAEPPAWIGDGSTWPSGME